MAHFDIGNRLAIYGWGKETDDFFYVVAKVWFRGLADSNEYRTFADHYRNVEQLLFHAEDAIKFAGQVKDVTGLAAIPTDEVLHTLSNLRKNKYLLKVREELLK